MWTAKNQIILAVAVLIGVVGVYYLVTNTDGSTNSQDKMLEYVREHDHESALVSAAQILKFDPSNQKAKQVISNSGQIFYYLRAAKSTLLELIVGNNSSTVDPKLLFKRFAIAREYVEKAKEIDPDSRSVADFEDTLDNAQSSLIHILSVKVFKTGQSVVDRASSNYKKTLEIVNTAESSKYLSTFLPYQSAWASVDSSVGNVRNKLTRDLEEMKEMGNLISNYKSGKSSSFAKQLQTYVKLVNTTVDTLLIPQGSFNDFSKSASSATNRYMKLQKKLRDDIPGSTLKQGAYLHLLNQIPDYKIAKNKEITKIINTNEALYTL